MKPVELRNQIVDIIARNTGSEGVWREAPVTPEELVRIDDEISQLIAELEFRYSVL